MKVFHGTDIISANKISGSPANVDVTKGGGELGRGFYAGESIALATAWAQGKYVTNNAIIEFDINNSDFVKLQILTINRAKYVIRRWKNFLKRGTANKHIFNTDVVCAPFATIEFSYQYKFESSKAQDTINNSSNKIL